MYLLLIKKLNFIFNYNRVANNSYYSQRRRQKDSSDL